MPRGVSENGFITAADPGLRVSELLGESVVCAVTARLV